MVNIAEVLSGQQGLAGIQQILQGASMRRQLRQTLSALLDPATQVGPCRLQRAKFKPGRKLTSYYDVVLRTQADQVACIRPIAVTWTLPEAFAKTGLTGKPVDGAQQPWETLQDEALQRGVAAPFQRLIASVPQWGMQLQVAPLDPRYPHLVRLSDPTYVRNVLATCPVGESTQPAGDYAVTAIRYRPGQRHVLRYTAAAGNPGPGTQFAKLYTSANNELAENMSRTVTRQRVIADWLASRTPNVTGLQPCAHWPDDQVILYPWVNGRPLSAQLRRPQRTLAGYLHQVGCALRTLHSIPAHALPDLPSHTFAAELKATTRTCEHIQALLPAVGQKLQGFFQRIQEHYAAAEPEAPTFTHGDFKADHVLVAQPPKARLTLIDFDSCALADPACDIGKFLADLDWWYALHGLLGLAQAQAAFLAGYNLAADHPRLARARLWERLIWAKMTAHRVPLFDPQWADQTTAMINGAVALSDV